MPTIIDSLRELVSPTIISAISRQTGESESGVSRGLSAAIPAIASTIAGRADDQGFVKNLFDLATKTAARPPVDAVNAFTTSPTGIDTTSPIGGWLSGLFGHNLSAVTDRIARYAGISGASATWLLSIAAPLVLGYIGRLVRSDNLSVSDLADVLRAQRAGLVSSLPTGFKMPEVFSTPYEKARTAGEMASKGMVGSAHGAAGRTRYRWTDLVGSPDACRMDRVAFVEVEPPSRAVGTTGTLGGTFVRTLPGNATITIPAVGSARGSPVAVPGFGQSWRDHHHARPHRVRHRFGRAHGGFQCAARQHRDDSPRLSTGARGGYWSYR